MMAFENEIYPDLAHVFKRRECSKFLPESSTDEICQCGRSLNEHSGLVKATFCKMEGYHLQRGEIWNISKHTSRGDTNAYGTIEFQGGSHPIKAQYVRLSYDTDPKKVFSLLTKKWKLRLPKLLMSIHGGKTNFELQPNLKKVIQEGLLKAAKTTEAWIFTDGTNSGVVNYVGDAFKNERAQTLRRKIATIGIAPWGIIGNREHLIRQNETVLYNSKCWQNKFPMLNDRHAFFLLVDDGKVDNYGCEVAFRRNLEKIVRRTTISQGEHNNQNFSSRENQYVNVNSYNADVFSSEKTRRIPIVAVIIEGGTNTIQRVLEYVTDRHPVPVVVCDGSGRAADLLAFTQKYIQDDGTLPESLQKHLLTKIRYTFDSSIEEANGVLQALIACANKKELITIFRMGEGQELDQAILTVLLQGSGLDPLDQFSLALEWNRVDVASSEIFAYGKEWTHDMLDQAMMEALAVNSVDFVKLLLENGAHMSSFLTIPRLEELYNSKRGPSNTLHHLIKDVRKHHVHAFYRYELPDIGLVVENLMGGAYRSHYRMKKFREMHYGIQQIQANIRRPDYTNSQNAKDEHAINATAFPLPYNDLFIWAVLTKRQEMALFMWKRGQEAIAKSLVAIKLYKRMAHEAEQDDLKTDISENFRNFSRTFEKLSVQLLDFCYRQNDTHAQKLLTCEWKNWGLQTCLTLAVSSNHSEFLAHPCCQVLLADLWMGGLRTRKSASLKVLVGLFIPFMIPTMEFKSRKELKCMPQTKDGPQDEWEGNPSVPAQVITINGSVQQSGNVVGSCKQNGQGTFHKSDSELTDKSFKSAEYKLDKLAIEQSLSLDEKIYEFYTSPLTKFLAYSISYFFFLCLFTYIVLVRMGTVPSWQELYCLLYVTTFTFEKFREIAIEEPVGYFQKCVVWMGNKWNPCDVVAIVIYYCAFTTRMLPPDLEVSRVIYAVDIMYWYLRILHILSVNKYLGPFVTMIGKMVINMSYFIVLLLVVLMAYGVARQGILHPFEDESWDLVMNVFYKPYFMLYGEVFADSINPPCGDGPELKPCRKGRWVAIIAMCLYLMVAYVLLMNLLIAVFNNIYLTVDAVAQQVWKSKRYSVVMEYEQKPFLPPPLILINHIQMLYKFIRRKCQTKRSCPVLKLILDEPEMSSLLNFEEECMDGLFLEEENKFNSSTCELVKVNNAKVEFLTQRVNDLYRRSSETVASLKAFKYTVKQLNLDSIKASNYLEVIHRYMISQGEEILVDDISSTDEEDFNCPLQLGGDRQDDHMDDLADQTSLKSSDAGAHDDGQWDTLDGVNSLFGDGPNPTQMAFYRKMRRKKHRPSLSIATTTTPLPSPNDEANSLPDENVQARTFATSHRRIRRISMPSSLVHLTPVCTAVNGSLSTKGFMRRRSSTRRSERSIGSVKHCSFDPNVVMYSEAPPTPDPRRLIHEYTSIMDEIETQELFANNRLVQPQTLPVSGYQALQRRHSHISNRSFKSTEQAVVAKEEHPQEAEKQDYKRSEKSSNCCTGNDSDTEVPLDSCTGTPSLKSRDSTPSDCGQPAQPFDIKVIIQEGGSDDTPASAMPSEDSSKA